MFHKRLMTEFHSMKKYTIGIVFTQWIMLLANIFLIWNVASFLEELSPKLQGLHTAVPVQNFENILLETDVVSGSSLSFSFHSFGRLFMIFIAVILIRNIMIWTGNKLSFFVSSYVKSSLRTKIFEKLTEIGGNYREVILSSEAVQISTEGVEQLEIYFGKYVPQFFYSLLAPFTLFLIVGRIDFKTAIVLLFCVPLIPVSIIAIQKFAKKMLNKYWGTYTELGDSFLENLQGLTTLKIYQADERYAKKMDDEAEKFRQITMRVLIMQLNSISIMDLIAYGGSALGILLSIFSYKNGTITFAESFFILMISAEFFLPLRLLGSFFHIAMNGNAAADKIFRLLDTPVKEETEHELPKDSSITFENVSFGYTKNTPVLKNLSFEIPEHSFTAIAGVSGCGKSTIASLIMGSTKEYNGTIRIGRVDEKKIGGSNLLKKITKIGHESYLFQGTVRENLLMGNKYATEEEMFHVLRLVDLERTILEKGGLSMQLDEKAANLSGGQRQRLALARALLHNSDIYIFDESTSNIDVESENQILNVIRNLAHEKTILFISHRLANLTDADQIFMLDHGEIKESGTFHELLRQNGSFAKMYQSQKELEQYTIDLTKGV